MPRQHLGTKNDHGHRERRGKREREGDLGKEVKKIRLQLGLLDTMYRLEVIRRQSLAEEIMNVASLEELQELKKSLKTPQLLGV